MKSLCRLGGTATGAETTALLAENTRIAGLTTASTAVTVDAVGGTAGGTGVSVATSVANRCDHCRISTPNYPAVTASRANYGADMMRLAPPWPRMQTASVNLSASYSRIMDTDYAAETAAQAKNNILQQAGTAVLAQANQTPNTVLTLLR